MPTNENKFLAIRVLQNDCSGKKNKIKKIFSTLENACDFISPAALLFLVIND